MRDQGGVVRADKTILRTVAILFGFALLCGCAAPRQERRQEATDSAVSAPLPTLETIYIDPRGQAPDYLPQMLPPDVMYNNPPSVGFRFYLDRPAGPYEDAQPKPEDGP
jgi:hypothetical protein